MSLHDQGRALLCEVDMIERDQSLGPRTNLTFRTMGA
jgi:hypothetical protein